MDECIQVENGEEIWMTPFVRYLKTTDIVEGEEREWVHKVAQYMLVGHELFKRGYKWPLLKGTT